MPNIWLDKFLLSFGFTKEWTPLCRKTDAVEKTGKFAEMRIEVDTLINSVFLNESISG
jgi:hypothetical protein